MFVESTDGKLYRNPMILHERWVLECSDEGVFVKRLGTMKWTTARRHVKEGGVKCRLLEELGQSTLILKERLAQVTVFKVKLLKPIPEPTLSNGYLTSTPDSEQMEGEEILQWMKKHGHNAMQNGNFSSHYSKKA